jgi:hypothetical protein
MSNAEDELSSVRKREERLDMLLDCAASEWNYSDRLSADSRTIEERSCVAYY